MGLYNQEMASPRVKTVAATLKPQKISVNVTIRTILSPPFFKLCRKYLPMRLLFALSLFVFLASCKNESTSESMQSDQAVTVTPPADLPAFQLKNEKGDLINISTLAGKKVFINIWASWCPPCRREMPSIQSLYGKVDKDKVAFVMLSLDEGMEDATDFMKSNSLNLPIYFPGGQLPSLLEVQSIPATFIFDEKGKLLRRIDGMHNYDSEEFTKLLSGAQ